MKTCKMCGQDKPISSYYQIKGRKNGFATCKTCVGIRRKDEGIKKVYIETRKGQTLTRIINLLYLLKGIKQCKKCLSIKSPEDFSTKKDTYDGLNYYCIKCCTEIARQARIRKREHYLNLARINYKKVAVARRAQQKVYRDKNRDRLNQYQREYRETNLSAAIALRLRTRINKVIKIQSTGKAYKLTQVLGCTIPELIRHLESKFQSGMNWVNKTEWHIDHIIPCSKFDLTDPEQQKVCFHYTNLQPLWAKENLIKNNKIVNPVQMKLPL